MNSNNNSSSSPVLLEPLKAPIALLRTGFIVPQQTTLLVKEHRSFLGGNFTAEQLHPHPDGSGATTTILTCTAKNWSKHNRTEFKNASGLPLFDLCMSWLSFSNAWYIELPAGGGQRIVTVAEKVWTSRVKLEVTLHSNAASAIHEEVTLQVDGEDAHSGTTQVLWQGRLVALIRMKSDLSLSKITMEFEVEVAAGMDQALVG